MSVVHDKHRLAGGRVKETSSAHPRPVTSCPVIVVPRLLVNLTISITMSFIAHYLHGIKQILQVFAAEVFSRWV